MADWKILVGNKAYFSVSVFSFNWNLRPYFLFAFVIFIYSTFSGHCSWNSENNNKFVLPCTLSLPPPREVYGIFPAVKESWTFLSDEQSITPVTQLDTLWCVLKILKNHGATHLCYSHDFFMKSSVPKSNTVAF